MSHLAKFTTKVTDSEALKLALIRSGINASRIEICSEAKVCHGYHKEETFKANVIVRRSRDFGSDIGWERNADGSFTVHSDAYNYGSDQHYDVAWQTRLETLYGVEKAKLELAAKGIAYKEDVDEKGRMRLTARFQTQDRISQLRMRG
jgi:hypothetical protein